MFTHKFCVFFAWTGIFVLLWAILLFVYYLSIISIICIILLFVLFGMYIKSQQKFL